MPAASIRRRVRPDEGDGGYSVLEAAIVLQRGNLAPRFLDLAEIDGRGNHAHILAAIG